MSFWTVACPAAPRSTVVLLARTRPAAKLMFDVAGVASPAGNTRKLPDAVWATVVTHGAAPVCPSTREQSETDTVGWVSLSVMVPCQGPPATVAFTGFTSETRKISPGPGPDHLIL